MIDRIRKALDVAYEMHKGQIRKVDKSPYIIHPLEVFAIACRFTTDEETLAAALLHDTIEDTEYTEERLREDFGEGVLELVALVTEDKSLAWGERKELYVKTLADSGNRKAALVSAADKINNLVSILETHEKMGDEIWGMFNAPLGKQICFYVSYCEKVGGLLPEEMREKLDGLVERFRALEAERWYN